MEFVAKSKKTLKPDIARKFQEQREKTALEAAVVRMVATCQSKLDIEGRINNQQITPSTAKLWTEVMRHFALAGWSVKLDNDKCSIWLD
jgi:hypothetical protein